MSQIYMFTGDPAPGRDFRLVSSREFFMVFTPVEAAAYLNTVRDRIRTEPTSDLQFFAAIRHIFCELDCAAKLYCGKRGKGDTSRTLVTFGIRYLGRVNPDYRALWGLLVDLYRHSLTHTGVPRLVSITVPQRGKILLCWGISGNDDGGQHLTLRRDGQFALLSFSVTRFRADAQAAVELYRDELKARGPQSALFGRFKCGYRGMASVFQPHPTNPTGVRASGRRRRGRPAPLVLSRNADPGIRLLTKRLAVM
jgi:hypothetical protein